jgi:ribose transport system permease protein
MRKLAPFAVLGIMVLVLGIAKPRFLATGNLLNIGTQMAPVALMAVGQMLVIISAGIDLSIGSVLALSGVVSTLLMAEFQLPLWLSLCAGVLVGTLCGWLNGLMITLGRIPPFIATLGMMGVARGLALILSGGVQVSVSDPNFSYIGNGRFLDVVPLPVIITLLVAVAGHMLLQQTKMGRYTYAIGSNREAAWLSGVNVDQTLRRIYTMSGALAGLAGIILMARLSSGQPAEGEGIELIVIAACVIGGASFSGGEGTVLGSVIGALIMGVLRNGCNLLQIPVFWQRVFIGAIIIIAVFADQYRKHRQQGPSG